MSVCDGGRGRYEQMSGCDGGRGRYEQMNGCDGGRGRYEQMNGNRWLGKPPPNDMYCLISGMAMHGIFTLA